MKIGERMRVRQGGMSFMVNPLAGVDRIDNLALLVTALDGKTLQLAYNLFL
jgi:hypothetical protein